MTTYLYYTDAFGSCQDVLENPIKYGTLLARKYQELCHEAKNRRSLCT